MRPIERLSIWMKIKGITPYAFEKACELSNGYLKKQEGGKGTLGSDVLEKIHSTYPLLNILWLLFEDGEMDIKPPETEISGQAQPQAQPQAQTENQVKNIDEPSAGSRQSELMKLQNQVILSLQDQIDILKAANADKDKIIALQDDKLNSYKSRSE